MKDAQGKLFAIGQKVARAAKLYKTDGLYVEIVEVTHVHNGKVYLAGSRVPIRFPERVVIVG